MAFRNWFRTKKSAPPQPHDPSLWTGGRILGKGGNGEAKVWTYIGTGNRRTEKFPQLVCQSIIIKTVLDGYALASFEAEHYAMKELLKGNEYHIMCMIADLGPNDKVYLEFCRNGDLDGEIKKRKRCGAGVLFTEEELSRLLVCWEKLR